MCRAQPAFAGSIVSWGSIAFDSAELDSNDFVDIACGRYHGVALKSDGSIVAWGSNHSSPRGNDFVAIAHSLALKSDGSIMGWGYDGSGQSTPPEGNDFISIAAGDYHSLALKSDGSIVAWGISDGCSADYGQVTETPEGNDFIAIAVGGHHNLALKKNGSVVAWGSNGHSILTTIGVRWIESGQCDVPSPNTGFVAVAAGGYHSLALKEDGSVVGWGNDDYGQSTPPQGNDFLAIKAGPGWSLALKSDGSIVGWGSNSACQANPPVGDDFVDIAAGDSHILAMRSDGSIFDSLSLDTKNPYIYETPHGNNFVAVAAGDNYSLALKSDGSAVGWGVDYTIYWCGGGTCMHSWTGQATPPYRNDFAVISAGSNHSLGLTAEGAVIGWGSNAYGQSTPPYGNEFVNTVAGIDVCGEGVVPQGAHSLALKADGTIVTWGRDDYGQATAPDGNDFVAISAGGGFCLALKANGSIIGWGRNDHGQATPPVGNTFVAIAAGAGMYECHEDAHSLALKSDGSIVGWGYNDHGQVDPPPGKDFVAIAAGGGYSLAIRESGPEELALLSPNSGEELIAGRIHTIEWQSSGVIPDVLIEYSDSNGVSWNPVSPVNAGNNHRYNWLVPNVDSQECLVRISDAGDPGLSDRSDAPFTIYNCTIPRAVDPSGDCRVDFADYAMIASYWLQCGNPFDPNCITE